MQIRKAKAADIESVVRIYGSIHDAEGEGRYVIGWKRGVYPTKETAEAALERGDLYVAEYNGQIYAAAIINGNELPEYKDGNWETDATDEEVLVLHTLVVDPESPVKGIGGEFVRFYEELARKRGCKSLRIDTQSKNLNARNFYPKFGFKEVGIVKCDFCGCGMVDLVLLEKKL